MNESLDQEHLMHLYKDKTYGYVYQHNLYFMIKNKLANTTALIPYMVKVSNDMERNIPSNLG